jgi:hypothetical protein
MHKPNLKSLFAMLIICVALTQATTLARIIYVDDDANGLNDGSSWPNACRFLQDALAYARSDPNANEIHVAQGIYKPDANSADPNGSGDRYATFELIDGVSLIGGYAGLCKPDPNIRDIQLYETILSGDLNGDDEPNFVNNGENSYTVAHIGWSSGTTTLDGFTVIGGNSGKYELRSAGGGINIEGGRILLRNCMFIHNCAVYGAAIAMKTPNSSGTITSRISKCLFRENRAEWYSGPTGCGAIYLRGYSPIVERCLFFKNEGCTGAGLYCYSFGGWPENEIYSNPFIFNCTFRCNHTLGRGAVIETRGECRVTMMNCILEGNLSDYWGAVLYEDGVFQTSNTSLVNCTILNNIACDKGAIIYSHLFSVSSLSNCIIYGNRDRSGMSESSLIYGNQGNQTVTSSCIQDDNPNDGYIPFGGSTNNNIDDNPRFVRNPNDGGDGWGVGDNDDFGDLHLLSNSPCIDAGNNNPVPPDIPDLDGDANTTEPTPLDIDMHPRFVNSDCNGTDIVDMGAYEFSYAYLGDFDNQCDVDFDDLKEIASHWLQKEPLVDIAPPPTGDGIVNFKDFAVLAEHWLEGTR